ncbi:hypothetical protein [Microbacterium nanhaiense]|uniref:hypothetical protein n=1 Tax=Microbacterium nanhaiense TaxID=1301026 RepID=UPI001666C83E|nr:hypothetical protein [Microbacterium nanhaiense]
MRSSAGGHRQFGSLDAPGLDRADCARYAEGDELVLVTANGQVLSPAKFGCVLRGFLDEQTRRREPSTRVTCEY